MTDTEKPAVIDALTAAEHGKLWATYMGNTMSKCVLSYFLKHVEDGEIEQIVRHGLHLSEQFVERIKEILVKDHIPIPVGFTEEDVNLDAPRLFLDEFYPHYMKYAAKAGMSIYGIAVPIMTRKDVRDFFTTCMSSTIELINEINDHLSKKGDLIKPPVIPKPKKVDFLKKQSYLKGFLGNIRPIQALEIAHFYDNIQNNATSKAVLIGFSQVAKRKQVKDFLDIGIGISEKHIEAFNQILHQNNLDCPIRFEHMVTHSTITPFSDKLMVAHKLDMFAMRIRTYGNSMAVNARHDLAALYAKFILEVGAYAEDGARILIDHGWLEQPPQAADSD